MPRTCIAVLLLVFVSICCEGGVPKDKAARTPALREPTKFLDVSGTVAGLDLQLEIEYQTHDPKCRVALSRLEGAYSPATYHHAVPVVRDGNRYTAKVPLDVVGETGCGWAPFAINYIALIDGKPQKQPVPPTPLVWFREGAPESLPPVRTECRGRICAIAPGEGFLSPGARRLELDFARR